MAILASPPIVGAEMKRSIDAIFVNAPLRDYAIRPRVNDFTLPVLGMAYIATFAKMQGFNVGVVDAEAHGIGVRDVARLINDVNPRWVGLNLLAPTYELSASIACLLDPQIKLMVGGHQAKAMPNEILQDKRFARLSALLIGESEERVTRLLEDEDSRIALPGVLWLDSDSKLRIGQGPLELLAPNIDRLPFVNRSFLVQDPFSSNGRFQASMVGARGCPYDCSFCGAAVSANPDVKIRTRDPQNIMQEMHDLYHVFGVTAFRFVDDLFLGFEKFISRCMKEFEAESIGDRFVWDATGRINVLNRLDDQALDKLVANGCREVALGIESGSARLLDYMGKRITPEMTMDVVRRLASRGINVKGYFILGFPTESRDELKATVGLVRDLWRVTDSLPGHFRASVFEFRPYPGTPEWDRLLTTGRYTPTQLLAYTALDLTDDGLDEAMRSRDEFNFSVNIQFGEASIDEVRTALVSLSREQHARKQAA